MHWQNTKNKHGISGKEKTPKLLNALFTADKLGYYLQLDLLKHFVELSKSLVDSASGVQT